MCSVLLHATVIRIDIYLNAWDDTARSLKGMVYWNSLWPTQIEDANEYRRVSQVLRQNFLALKLSRLSVTANQTGRS